MAGNFGTSSANALLIALSIAISASFSTAATKEDTLKSPACIALSEESGFDILTNGVHLPSFGTLRALMVVCKFSDDNFDYPPLTDRWPSTLDQVEEFPAWINSLLSPTVQSSYPVESLSGWYHVMSHGNLQIIGDVYKYVPQHPRSYYHRNSAATGNNRRGMGFLSREVIDYFDPIVNYANYDNLDPSDFDRDGSFNEPDGIVDMIILAYRFFDSREIQQYPTCQNPPPPPQPNPNIAFQGIAALDWCGDFFPLTRDGKQIRGRFPGSGIVSELYTPSEIPLLAHEIGHYLWGGDHYEQLGLYGNKKGNNAFEQLQMGWISPEVINTTSSRALSDFLSSGYALRIPIAGTNEFFLLENHQMVNVYDTFPRWHTGPPLFPAAPGILVLHCRNLTTFGGNSPDVECADGRFNYTFNPPDAPIKGSSNASNGYDELDIWYITAIAQRSQYPNGSFGNPGNSDDTYALGYNTVFSRWSNPNTKRFATSPIEDMGFEFTSLNGLHANVTVYIGDPENASPAKPQDLTATAGGIYQPVVLNWNANLEPDLSQYKIYRAWNYSSTPPTSGYDLIATLAAYDGGSPVTSYTDYETFAYPSSWWVHYKMKARDTTGKESVYSNTASYNAVLYKIPTGGDEVVVGDYSLGQNSPNPFNPQTEIRYELAEDSHVSLKVYNVLGEEVRSLIGEEQLAGSYWVRWDARDHLGQAVPSGV